METEKIRHIADTKSGIFYHLDENNMVWTCNCSKKNPNERGSLCITITQELKLEGELNDLKRQINDKRKELGFLTSETLEEGYKRLLESNNK